MNLADAVYEDFFFLAWHLVFPEDYRLDIIVLSKGNKFNSNFII